MIVKLARNNIDGSVILDSDRRGIYVVYFLNGVNLFTICKFALQSRYAIHRRSKIKLRVCRLRNRDYLFKKLK